MPDRLDPLESAHRSARRLLCVQWDAETKFVFQIKKPRQSDLLEYGWVAPFAEETIERVRASKITTTEHEGRLAACTSDEERSRVQGEINASKTAELAPVTEAEARTLFEREGIMIMAAVEAMGYGLDTTPPGLLPIGTNPDQVCPAWSTDSAGGPVYLRPLRVVPPGQATMPGSLSLSEFSDASVLFMGLAIWTLSIPNREVTTFRE